MTYQIIVDDLPGYLAEHRRALDRGYYPIKGWIDENGWHLEFQTADQFPERPDFSALYEKWDEEDKHLSNERQQY
jgi:hypothetical protein